MNVTADMAHTIKILEEQERTLQFDEFTSEMALAIGLSIVERAKRENKAVTVDITRYGHKLFHYAFDGTSPDNEEWVIRKNRIVNRFHKSSLHFRMKLLESQKSLEEKYFISSSEYSPYGGSFPIILKNTGTIGTITVSGLTQEEDHELVVWAIRQYLESKQTDKEIACMNDVVGEHLSTKI